jgi:hypothetical protein
MKKEFEWKTFDGGRAGRSSIKSFISITKQKKIGLNKHFIVKTLKSKPKFVQFASDNDDGVLRIGFLFKDKNDAISRRVFYPKFDNGYIIANSFLNSIGFKSEWVGHYDPLFDIKSGIWYIELKGGET